MAEMEVPGWVFDSFLRSWVIETDHDVARFTPRECAVLHDVHYDGRSVLYRLSLSEMTVPYGDPRPPFHRKQAFDFGDAGAGRAANNLALGCDCLGVIKYLDAMLVNSDGEPSLSRRYVNVSSLVEPSTANSRSPPPGVHDLIIPGND